MKCCSPRLGLARRLLALSISLALSVSSYVFVTASAKSPSVAANADSSSSNSEVQLTLTSSSATPTGAGVLLRWTTNPVADNLGFNIYRLQNDQRTRLNKEIIPGALFKPGTAAQNPGGYSYAWFDRGGSADSIYFIESVNVDGVPNLHDPIVPVTSKVVSNLNPTIEMASGAASDSVNTFEKRYPTEETQLPNSGNGTIATQWEIAAQTALKIAVNKDGWYRVTQPQMVAAGFNPVVDIRNLRLFLSANEVAINTSQLTGRFGSGDYIEFFGRGLDTPTTDKGIYYLIAGTTPGKRVAGGIQLDGDPPTAPPPTPSPAPIADPSVNSSGPPVLRGAIFYSWLQNDIDYLVESLKPAKAPNRETSNSAATDVVTDAGANDLPDNPNSAAAPAFSSVSSTTTRESKPTENAHDVSAKNATSSADISPSPAGAAPASELNQNTKLRKRSRARLRSKRSARRQRKQERNHALLAAAASLPSFDYTVQIKERLVYYANLLNGDEENFFGRVISSSPVTQTLTVSNPDLTAAGPASVQFALQGVLNQSGTNHDVTVSFNGVTIGSVQFQPLEHPVRTFPIPIALIQNGNNSLTFTKTSTGEVCIVDYIRFTYPHSFRADSNALKFNLRGTQTVKVDGFSSPSLRLIDYTDPLNVSIRKPSSENTASGYAITIPMSESRSKPQRLLYAFPQGQFDQVAGLSVSQPSRLNLGHLSPTITSGADFLIIAHKNFIASMTPLLNKRQTEGKIAAVVDVDDIYDEFSYGLHGPQALRDFLSLTLTSSNWVTKPKYLIFAGDASFDPRNYLGNGDVDFVPTKLIDATYNETVSDDWVADFHGGTNDGPDGISDIAVGRLPVGTVAAADLVVSKIVNFQPQQTQSAMLVADEDPLNIFGFAATNDVFESLLPDTMSVQRLNRAPQPAGVPSQTLVKSDIVNGFNSGPALVNYSGHGNVDVWTGAALFTSSDATALTNGTNKLSFVVVMDCLNGYFQDPNLLSLSEALLNAPNGGAVAAFASSGLTIAQGQHEMGQSLYSQIYSGSPIALGDAIKIAKASSFDIDVKRTWIFFGDPSLKIR